MRYFLLLVPLLLSGCAAVQPVDRPCGVVTDSLQNVNATSRVGNQRLAVHFERGLSAGCWKRVGGLPVLVDAPRPHPHVHGVRPVPVPIARPVADQPEVIVEPDPEPESTPTLSSDPMHAEPPPKRTFREDVVHHLRSGIKW